MNRGREQGWSDGSCHFCKEVQKFTEGGWHYRGLMTKDAKYLFQTRCVGIHPGCFSVLEYNNQVSTRLT